MKRLFKVMLLVFYCASNLIAQEYQYSYNDTKIKLDLNTDFAYLLLEDVTDAAQLTDMLGTDVQVNRLEPYTVSSLLLPVPGNDMRSEYRMSWAEVEFAGGFSQDEYWNVLSEIERNEEVLLASPYFRDKNGDKLGLSDVLYVKIPQRDDVSPLLELAEETGVAVLGRNKFLPNWYIVSCSKTSDGNALDMANYFHESGRFLNAEPDIMPENIAALHNRFHVW